MKPFLLKVQGTSWKYLTLKEETVETYQIGLKILDHYWWEERSVTETALSSIVIIPFMLSYVAYPYSRYLIF